MSSDSVFISLLDALKAESITDPIPDRIAKLAEKVETHGCYGPGPFGKPSPVDDLAIPLQALEELYQHYRKLAFTDPLDCFSEDPVLSRYGWPKEIPEDVTYKPKGTAKGVAARYNKWLLTKIGIDAEKPNVSQIMKKAEEDGIKLTHPALTKHLRAVGVLPKSDK